MQMKIVLGLVVFATLYHVGYTCSCMPHLNVQQRYCTSDFVMKVRIRSNLRNPSGEQGFDDFYRVRRISSPWKIPPGVSLPRRFRVYTASNDGLCGVHLERRERYLISGSIDQNGRLRIGLCGSIAERTPLQSSISRLRRTPPNCIQISGPTQIKAAAGSKK